MELLPEPFELKVMGLALRGNSAWVMGMRSQLPHLTVAERKSTGSGFTTDFCCADAAAPVVVPRAADGLPIREYPPAVNARRRSPTEGLVSFHLDFPMKSLASSPAAFAVDIWKQY